MDAKLLNGLSLAYMGDCIYELYIREFILKMGYNKVKDLHKNAVNFTSGEAQAFIIHSMLSENMLTEEELTVFKRGRNSHINSVRKNIKLQDYLDATGFEALLGYLYLDNQKERLEELINYSIEKRSGKND